jgi:hypothetical protein
MQDYRSKAIVIQNKRDVSTNTKQINLYPLSILNEVVYSLVSPYTLDSTKNSQLITDYNAGGIPKPNDIRMLIMKN